MLLARQLQKHCNFIHRERIYRHMYMCIYIQYIISVQQSVDITSTADIHRMSPGLTALNVIAIMQRC